MNFSQAGLALSQHRTVRAAVYVLIGCAAIFFYYQPQVIWAQAATPITATATITTAGQTEERPTLVIGLYEKEEVDQQLADLIEVALFGEGYALTRTTFADLPALLTALEAGTIDLALARPVDALVRQYDLPLNALPTDPTRLSQFVDSLAAAHGVHWLAATSFNQPYALFAVETTAEPSSPATQIALPQLATFQQSTAAQLTLCAPSSDADLLASTLDALADSYTLKFAATQQKLIRETAGQPLALAGCSLFFGADIPRRLEEKTRLRPLADPDHFFPPNRLTLVVRRALAETLPNFREQWAVLATAIDAAALSQLTAQQSPATTPLTTTVESTTTVAAAPPRSLATTYQFLLDQGVMTRPTLTVRTRDETAQRLLGEMVVQLLQTRGYAVVDEVGQLNAADVVESVERGDADIVVALLGDLLTLQSTPPITTLPKGLTATLALIQAQQIDHDLVTLPPAPFSLTPVLLVDEDLAGLGVTTLSRLATYMNAYNAPFSLCVDSDFYSHPIIGLNELELFYGFHFEPDKIHLMDEDSIFTAIQERQCQVTVGTITDGRVAAWHLLPLRDDLGFFPLNNPLVLTRRTLFSRQFGLQELLERSLPVLDTATMQQLTTQVELGADGIYLSGDEESAAQVAHTFLLDQQLLTPASPSSAGEGANPERSPDLEELPTSPETE